MLIALKNVDYFFVDGLSSPAQRALVSKNSINLEELSKFTKTEILAVHGIRKLTIPILEKALTDNNLTFKN